ncbi:MAG: NarK/NasA family nitrate transporter [Deltaproteobacteria bacterium]|nr:NarK/NasA family nitrate transporter [Deltaproteobacteria bacterium]
MEPSTEKLPNKIVFNNAFAFSIAFAAWVMFGPSIRVIAQEFGLSASEAAFIKVVPILTGSILRIPVGIITDRIGARRTFSSLLILGAFAAFFMPFLSTAFSFVVAGLVLGLVGTTFVVGVQSVSSWTPPGKQGLALGIFGAGNVGTAITTLGMPLLLGIVGWQVAFRIYAVVLFVVGVGYLFMVQDAPQKGARPSLKSLLEPAKSPVSWMFGLYYTASFGVFVATTLLIGDIYIDQYGLDLPTTGLIVTSFTFTASLSRIPGGALADRFGSQKLLLVSLPMIALTLAPVVMSPPLYITAILFFISALFMGFAMAATFKAIPARFPGRVGVIGGLVGAIGGLGGFYLPLVGAYAATTLGAASWQVLPLVSVALIATSVAIGDALRSAKPALAGAVNKVERSISSSRLTAVH